MFFLSSCRKAKGSIDLLFCQVFKILRDGCEILTIFALEVCNFLFVCYIKDNVLLWGGHHRRTRKFDNLYISANASKSAGEALFMGISDYEN